MNLKPFIVSALILFPFAVWSAPAAICPVPIQPVDTSSPDAVVGTGTAGSCTRAALQTAINTAQVNGGTKVTFNCGGAHTITVTNVINVPTNKDVTIDGGGVITLDGNNPTHTNGGTRTRIFEAVDAGFRTNSHTLTLQNITVQNAHAPYSDFLAQDSANPFCAYGYKDGKGGAVLVENMQLHIINSSLLNNKGAPSGPDTGGGAIYVRGSLDVQIIGSTLDGNSAANGGGIAMLQTEGNFVNSEFLNNGATGDGGNRNGAKMGATGNGAACPTFNHNGQGGAGGIGGGIYIDGSQVVKSDQCGTVIQGNTAGQVAGGFFRTPNQSRGNMLVDRATYKDNVAEDGGGGIYIQDMDLVVKQSLFDGNIGTNGAGGGIRLGFGPHGSVFDIENTTFVDNASGTLGGGFDANADGILRNVTFSGNTITTVGGFMGAAVHARRAVEYQNVLFQDNTTPNPTNPMTCRYVGATAAGTGSNNWQWPRKRSDNTTDDNACMPGVTWQSAGLLPLASNGGHNQTMLLPGGSAALTAGQNCPSVDQKGDPRSANNCALGAAEPSTGGGQTSPIAANDSHTTSVDTALNVAAPGVLGNDSDPQNDALTAVLDTDVSNGTLTLNANGSFDYTPNAGYLGSDSFTYFANDGSENSQGSATVNLQVIAPTGADVDLIAHLEFEDFRSPNISSDSGSFGQCAIIDGSVYNADTGDGSTNAMEFTGNDSVNLGNFDVAGSGLTLAMWIKADSVNDVNFRQHSLVSKAFGYADIKHIFELGTLQIATETRPRARIRVGGVTTTLTADVSADITVGNWHHVAVTYNGAEMILYLNGNDVGSTPLTGSVDQDNTVATHVGRHPNGQRGWDGKIDDVRILQRALTPAEITALQ